MIGDDACRRRCGPTLVRRAAVGVRSSQQRERPFPKSLDHTASCLPRPFLRTESVGLDFGGRPRLSPVLCAPVARARRWPARGGSWIAEDPRSLWECFAGRGTVVQEPRRPISQVVASYSILPALSFGIDR